MSDSSTCKRVTRSMSAQPPCSSTVPGPPVSSSTTSDSSKTPISSSSIMIRTSKARCNPFQVDLVIPFSIALGNRGKNGDRKAAETEVKEEYEELLRVLEGAGGLRIATRAGRGVKGKEQVWVFVGASEEKVEELAEWERRLDKSHGIPLHPCPPKPSPATRLRLLYDLLTSPLIQGGLGITPGEGKWKRVKSIAALHDEEDDMNWLERWTMADWKMGLFKGLEGADDGLGDHQSPPVHLYFAFLTSYTLSLLPLSLTSILIYLLTPPDSYHPIYSLILSLYSTIFISFWRIRERKLAVRWGTRGCESVAVGRLRPEYVANQGLGGERRGETSLVDAISRGDQLKRDVKVAVSVPIIVCCGAVLGVVLMGIFVLEAFVSEVYDGFGKQIVPLIPTALFAIIVPQIVSLFNAMSWYLVKWEDHPTPIGAEKSLTAKTFAMNAIVAYLGLFLSAYVYVPFGPHIMSQVQSRLVAYQSRGTNVTETPEKIGLGPRTHAEHQHHIKADRLKTQLFAYTVTNQVVNTFLETGLPFILRFANDWRSGKTTVKDAMKVRKLGNDKTEKNSVMSSEEVEKHFLDKVERELALPEYNTFTDYAEMVTQFGYVTVWSIVWPLAPVFALLNNYFELRTDALKICKHVRRPVGDRVETIGSWLDTLSVISWLGAVTNATLIYLFRPTLDLSLSHQQSSNSTTSQSPSNFIAQPGSKYLSHILSTYDSSPNLQTLLPTLIPLVAVALAASHGYLVLRWVVDNVVERVLWRGSEEEREVQRLREGDVGGTEEEVMIKRENVKENGKRKVYRDDLAGKGFWNGGEEGAREIGRLTKAD